LAALQERAPAKRQLVPGNRKREGEECCDARWRKPRENEREKKRDSECGEKKRRRAVLCVARFSPMAATAMTLLFSRLRPTTSSSPLPPSPLLCKLASVLEEGIEKRSEQKWLKLV